MKRQALKADPVTRDLVVSGGKLATVKNIDAVLQNCDNAMRQQLGELQYRKTKGVDYFNNVFSGNPNYQLFKFQAITNIESVSGVVRVTQFDYDIIDGTLSYSASILTDYGTGTINGSV